STLAQPFQAILAQRLQQPKPARLAPGCRQDQDQRLLHQPAQHLQHFVLGEARRRPHLLCRRQREPASKHGQPPEEGALPSPKPARPAPARSTNKRPASYSRSRATASPPASTTSAGSGTASEGTTQATSPGMFSASRLVASRRRWGQPCKSASAN